MRRILHLSDLHFGRLDRATLAPLARAVRELAADLVVISGDVSQRARPREFREARAFLDALDAPVLATPGNHDVPLWSVGERLLRPLARYRRYFHPDPEPEFLDPELAVLGVNTARALAIKAGRVNEAQMDRIRARLAPRHRQRTTVVVTHHPVAVPAAIAESAAGRATLALAAMAESGVDLLLAGHLHRAHAFVVRAPLAGATRGLLAVASGTASSSRRRHGQENGFNLLTVVPGRIEVQRWRFDTRTFAPESRVDGFVERDPEGWMPLLDGLEA